MLTSCAPTLLVTLARSSALLMFGAAAQAPAARSHNPNNDVEVPSAAEDGISCVAWSPTSNLLVAGSWDQQVRCWDVQMNGQAVPKAAQRHDAPVLCAAWGGDGARVFTGGGDKMAKVWDLATNQCMQVAQHDAPIKSIFWVQEMNCIVTAGWDKTVRYWDGKSPTPKATLQLPERAYCMDVKYPLMVVGTADRKVIVVNLTQPTTIYNQVQSTLKYQYRCVACFPDQQGFCLGSIEGAPRRRAILGATRRNSAQFSAQFAHR